MTSEQIFKLTEKGFVEIELCSNCDSELLENDTDLCEDCEEEAINNGFCINCGSNPKYVKVDTGDQSFVQYRFCKKCLEPKEDSLQ